jgi:hypothetical protein
VRGGVVLEADMIEGSPEVIEDPMIIGFAPPSRNPVKSRPRRAALRALLRFAGEGRPATGVTASLRLSEAATLC